MMKTDEGTRLDLPVGAKVYAGEKPCGRSISLVLNPVTDEVTDVAIELNGFGDHEVLVPLEHVVRSSENGIWFDLSKDEISALPEFLRTEFIQAEIPKEYAGGALVLWPYLVSESKNIPVEVEMVPVDELAVHVGAEVISLDGKVGTVDEFLVDPQNDHISHLVMHEGHLWGKKDVFIPVSDISRMDEHSVKVDLDKQQIEALPELPAHRSEKWFSKG
ncbi:MAG: PRC-barrel domain-containing protein [Anaerolineales bacterium]